MRLLSVEQIAARLDDAFRLLTGGSRTVLSRHQTLRALIDWSYNLLSPWERTLFLRLSVFAGGFTLEAVEHVCADPRRAENAMNETMGGSLTAADIDPDAVLDLLTQLADKSLINPAEPPEPDPQQAENEPVFEPELRLEVIEERRYRMLETIRQYARDKLHDLGAGLHVRDRHLAYFLLLSEEAEPYLRSAEQAAWLDRLDTELDNLRLALEWSLARRVEEGLRLAAALFWFWHIRGHAREGGEWLVQLLAAGQWPPEQTISPNRRLTRARALITAGFLLQFQSQPELAPPMLEEAVALLRGLGSGRAALAGRGPAVPL